MGSCRGVIKPDMVFSKEPDWCLQNTEWSGGDGGDQDWGQDISWEAAARSRFSVKDGRCGPGTAGRQWEGETWCPSSVLLLWWALHVFSWEFSFSYIGCTVMVSLAHFLLPAERGIICPETSQNILPQQQVLEETSPAFASLRAAPTERIILNPVLLEARTIHFACCHLELPPDGSCDRVLQTWLGLQFST